MGGAHVIIISYLKKSVGMEDGTKPFHVDYLPLERNSKDRDKMVSQLSELENLLESIDGQYVSNADNFISDFPSEPKQADLDHLYGIAKYHNTFGTRSDAVNLLAENGYSPNALREIFLHDEHLGVRKTAHDAYRSTLPHKLLFERVKSVAEKIVRKPLTRVSRDGTFNYS